MFTFHLAGRGSRRLFYLVFMFHLTGRGSRRLFYPVFLRFILQVEIQEGYLECPETGRKFPITNGIPNMLLNEDEL